MVILIIMESISKCKRMQLDRKFVYGDGEENVNDSYDIECRIFDIISHFEFIKMVGMIQLNCFLFLRITITLFPSVFFKLTKSILEGKNKNICNNKVNIYLFCFIHSFIVAL